MIRSGLYLITIAFIVACSTPNDKVPDIQEQSHLAFDTSMLQIKSEEINLLRGQVLYVPIYSNLPFPDAAQSKSKKVGLSAVLVIHNTDLSHTIQITGILYFNNDGKLVKNYLDDKIVLNPLASHNFYVPKNDTSGTGSNFIVEWISGMPVTEPIIESVMLDLVTAQGISFLSKPRILREYK